MKKIFLAVLILINLEIFAQDTIPSTWGKRLSFVAQDSTFTFKFGFRFQTLYEGKYDVMDGQYEDALQVRRARLKFDGWAIDPDLVYTLELAISNRDQQSGQIDESGSTASIVLDAVIKWEFIENWQLWFGQAKLPGNRERVISSQELQFVDRSLANSYFNLDRDLGIQLHHQSASDRFRQMFAISMGQGRNIIVNNPGRGKQITGRLEFLPMGSFSGNGDYVGSSITKETSPKLSIGITVDLNINAIRTQGNLGEFIVDSLRDEMSGNLVSLMTDMMFKYKGISVMSEFVKRTSEVDTGIYGTGTGFVFQVGYLFPSNWEVAGRFTDINADATQTVFADQKEYTLGLSRYVSGHDLKFQTDISYQTFPGQTTEYLIFRFQTEIAL